MEGPPWPGPEIVITGPLSTSFHSILRSSSRLYVPCKCVCCHSILLYSVFRASKSSGPIRRGTERTAWSVDRKRCQGGGKRCLYATPSGSIPIELTQQGSYAPSSTASLCTAGARPRCPQMSLSVLLCLSLSEEGIPICKASRQAS